MVLIRLALVALLMSTTAGPARAEWFGDVQQKMGTRIEIQLWHDDPAEARRLLAAGMAEFDRIEQAMSTYRVDSEISAVNRSGALGPVPVSAELGQLVAKSLGLSRQTDGAFDITFDSVGYHYDFRARQRPDAATIARDLPAVDYRHVEVRADGRAIAFARPGTRINLGGIAKGHSCEQVIALLRAAGVRHALATAGGDTRFLGDRRGQPWVVGIRDPDDATRVVTRLALDNEAVSTSGDYERYFDDAGVRYHHILNPATGTSATGVRSVTVIGPDATLTDGLSTSVFIMGSDSGLRLVESLPGYEAIVVDDRHGVRFSRGLQPR